ncbi:MAG: hypothetical protein ACLFRI_04975 [Candidatus Izemoplasmataceae bacterium]
MATKMIVTIIKKGYAKKLMQITRDLKVDQTIFIKGRGTVNPAYFESLTNVTYDPDRDIIISLVDIDKVKHYKDAFTDIGELTKKNTGILLVFEAYDLLRIKQHKEDAHA